MIELNFDVPFVANLARREKQIQQNYRPVIAVHKWFARRPGTLFRALLLAEFSSPPLAESFYKSGNLNGKVIADPFMGGGTPLLEANRLGADIQGCDINPMAYWIVRQEIEHLDVAVYKEAAEILRTGLEDEIGFLYKTGCRLCGNPAAQVKYFLWVKTMPCRACGRIIDLFPGYLVAENVRHPGNVFVCASCGRLTETVDCKKPGFCAYCNAGLTPAGPAKKNKCRCGHCGEENSYPQSHAGPPTHRLFALEYHCPKCKPAHKGRFFKSLGFTPPELADLALRHSKIDITQTQARALDRKIRLAPAAPLKIKRDALNRFKAMVETPCFLLKKGAPDRTPGLLHRLDKADTKHGLIGCRNFSGMGVPYAMLLYERFLGRPFAGHRDSISGQVGDILETAIEDVLTKANISFRKTRRAERIPGFDQAPDFILPDEFNPQVVIEAKITTDDGTARDKVTRIQHLADESRKKASKNSLSFEVIACIGGRGFGIRREDMRKLLPATKGKVFTYKTIQSLLLVLK
ncbi:MAG: DUF1156 domain-containing protein [Candidatus Adiutrix sp.]|jgi:hypothetical protein|nr:DUF1156 domain-containing protein [Candidatus Adiutrix sp.]